MTDCQQFFNLVPLNSEIDIKSEIVCYKIFANENSVCQLFKEQNDSIRCVHSLHSTCTVE